MVKIGENVGWLATTIGAGTVAIASWVLESGYLATIGGIIIGAGLTYFVEQRNQKRTWKREYALRSAVEVYGVLYNELKALILGLEQKVYRNESFRTWSEMQNDHRYFMVDDEFRLKLDKFFVDLENLSKTVSSIRHEIIPEIVIAETEKVTGEKPLHMPTIHASYKSQNNPSSTSVRTEECVITLTHPVKRAIKYEKEVSDERFYINYDTENKNNQTLADSIKLEEYWQNIMVNFSQNETYKLMISENERLLGEAKKLQKEITQRIEEPWKI